MLSHAGMSGSRTEFQRIAALARLFGPATAPDVGIGDDAAVLHPSTAVLATVDAAVEGVHFRREFATLDVVSQRAIEAAASDIAAMGGTLSGPGCGLLLAWGLPHNLGENDFLALGHGALAAAERLDTAVLGGNLSASPVLSLTTTILGRSGARVVTRGGARPGDIVAVSGASGAAAAGLHALLLGLGDDPALKDVIARWRFPRARVDLASEVARVATAAIDVSDGLLADAAHLASASSCHLRIRLNALPVTESLRTSATRLGLPLEALMLSGGEDYNLLITAEKAQVGPPWIVIGEVLAGGGVEVVDEMGDLVLVSARGWDHFED